MNDNIDFYTATMAALYAKQGHLEKAAEIYRYLLKDEPGRQDIIEALADIEAVLYGDDKAGEAEIALLINKWVDLVLDAHRVKALKRVRKKLSGE